MKKNKNFSSYTMNKLYREPQDFTVENNLYAKKQAFKSDEILKYK